MSARAAIRREGVPFVFGIACLLALVALIEVLVTTGWINPFIVPKPSRHHASSEATHEADSFG